MNSKLYPENWNDEIRPAILKRDKFACRHCFVKHRSYVMRDQSGQIIRIEKSEFDELDKRIYNTYRIYLQIAHLDQNKNNNEFTNLLSLCPNCHLKYDAPFKAIKRLTNHRNEMPDYTINVSIQQFKSLCSLPKAWLLLVPKSAALVKNDYMIVVEVGPDGIPTGPTASGKCTGLTLTDMVKPPKGFIFAHFEPHVLLF